MSEGDNSTPLEGIRVVENTVWAAGTLAAKMLGNLGAEVIKVERPGGGPEGGQQKLMGIQMGTKSDGSPAPRVDVSSPNSKKITLNLTKEKGREVMYRLIKKSNAFIQNLAPGNAELLGIDYKTLSQYNPSLVYGTICGYGQRGPDATVPSQDPTGLARSGLMFAAHPGKDPTYLVAVLADTWTGGTLAYGMLAALLHQKRTGVGQELVVSQLGSLMWLHFVHVAVNLLTGQEFKEHERSKASNPLMNWYKCQDENYICFSSQQPDIHWPEYCEILGIKDLEKDPRFENAAAREEHAEELIAIMDKIFATKPREEWLQIFRKTKSGIAFAPVHRVSGMSSDPQILANDYITPFEHHLAGTVLTNGRPVEFSKSAYPGRQRGPELGENTEEVLVDLCGYSWEEIEVMGKEGVI